MIIYGVFLSSSCIVRISMYTFSDTIIKCYLLNICIRNFKFLYADSLFG